MAQVFFLVFGMQNIFFSFQTGFAGIAISAEFGFGIFKQERISSESVQHVAMIGGIQKSLIVKLAVNFYQIFAGFFQ